MENEKWKNGKLNISKSSKGNSIVKVLFLDGEGKLIIEKGKPKGPIVQKADISEEYNGKNIKFECDENGQPIKIIHEGEVLFPKAEQQASSKKLEPKQQNFVKLELQVPPKQNISISDNEDEMKIDHLEKVQYPASAPYNFIPLNKIVVEAEEIPDFDRYYDGKYTGWIDLEIETKTPLYIRDTLTKPELDAGKESKDNPDFFSPAGKLRIPGSSLRGMVRTLVEIVSFGKFGFFDDKRLYFRSFAESLKEIYSHKMIKEINGVHTIKPLAGYLKKRGSNFVIIPALTTNNMTYYKVEESLLLGKPFYHQAMSISFSKDGKARYKPNKNYKFFLKSVVFKKESPKVHKHTEVSLYYGKVTDIDLPENVNAQDWKKGTLVCTGWVPSKRKGKHTHWVVNEEDQSGKSLKIDDNLLKSYKDDVNREEQADLLEQLKKYPKGVPCFYITDEQGQVNSFGHTGMFRLAYEKTIGDHIPENLKDKTKTDMAEAIFGKVGKDKEEKTIAGRVFFEDAFLEKDQQAKDVLMGEKTPKILAAPKPTTFQHYLEPSKDKGLNHYNSDSADIRGYKLYWHKSGNGWEEADKGKIQKAPKQYTKITPVKPKTKFSGRIRFENLSAVELGALLFSLDLPEGRYHKLGMGKPLGLGSVRITPKLHLSDRKKRYTELFAEWGNDIPVSDNIQNIKKIFKQYILGKIGESEKKILWNTERLKELKLMLDYEMGKSMESQNEYMEIGKFKPRPILPKPSCCLSV